MVPEESHRFYYDHKGVEIREDRCVIRNDVYLFQSMQGYELRVISPNRRVPLTLIFAGILLLILGIGFIFLVIGIWMWVKQDTEYWLVFTTDTINEDLVFQTKNLKDATDIKEALDAAITRFLKL